MTGRHRLPLLLLSVLSGSSLISAGIVSLVRDGSIAVSTVPLSLGLISLVGVAQPLAHSMRPGRPESSVAMRVYMSLIPIGFLAVAAAVLWSVSTSRDDPLLLQWVGFVGSVLTSSVGFVMVVALLDANNRE